MRTFQVWIVLLAIVLGEISARPSSEEPKRLIQTNGAEWGRWLTQEEIRDLTIKKVNFMDITDRKFPTTFKEGPSPQGKV